MQLKQGKNEKKVIGSADVIGSGKKMERRKP